MYLATFMQNIKFLALKMSYLDSPNQKLKLPPPSGKITLKLCPLQCYIIYYPQCKSVNRPAVHQLDICDEYLC